MTAAAFLMGMNPTLEEVEDVKTAVSEAVTNAIVHGCTDEAEQVELECTQEQSRMTVVVRDCGVGIADIKQAMQPFYTSKPQQERTGMGFAFMEAFMDEVHVESAPGAGTTVTMVKYIAGADAR
jgi:stage II sporulation protein AB (anti-sigma F factor)